VNGVGIHCFKACLLYDDVLATSNYWSIWGLLILHIGPDGQRILENCKGFEVSRVSPSIPVKACTFPLHEYQSTVSKTVRTLMKRR